MPLGLKMIDVIVFLTLTLVRPLNDYCCPKDEARCVRTMCRVTRLHTRLHRIRTVDLLKRVNLSAMDDYISRKQLRWLGHVARMKKERYPRKFLTSWVRHRRPRGAPQFTYGRGVTKAMKKVDITKDEWYTLAQDRVAWRSRIYR